MRFLVLCLTSPLALLETAAVGAQAAPSPGCTAPKYREFDFWLGHWEVHAANGRRAGTNRIEKTLDGCALTEQWIGTGSRGMSINFYDAGSAKWHQTWIDDRGQPLYLDGALRDGKMVLEGTTRGADGRRVRQRITWTRLDGGDVRQLWETSSDDGATWTTVFDGRYSRLRSP
jgi:hypothetical protein